MPSAACEAEARVGQAGWLQGFLLGACALPAPGEVSVPAGHRAARGCVSVAPAPPGSTCRRPGQTRAGGSTAADAGDGFGT